MKKIKVTQIKSKIGSSQKQKATLEALGLRKINASKEHDASSQILGMIAKVSHLVVVEELK